MRAPATGAPAAYTRPFNRRARVVNAIMYSLCCASALLAIAVLFAIIGYVIYRGAASLKITLFTHDPPGHPAGMRNCIEGTLRLIATSSCVGVPLGCSAASTWPSLHATAFFRALVRVTVDVLAGTPSVIVGVLAYQLWSSR